MYGVLKVLEERGQVRRGYFVSGLGAAQFALPGAVDRLRQVRERADDGVAGAVAAPVVLAATDPAQPYGAALAWPDTAGRPARTGAALVVLRDGVPLAWFDRRSFHLVTFPATLDDRSWAEALADLVRAGRLRKVEVRKVDGDPLATVSGRQPRSPRGQGRRLRRRLPRPRVPVALTVRIWAGIVSIGYWAGIVSAAGKEPAQIERGGQSVRRTPRRPAQARSLTWRAIWSGSKRSPRSTRRRLAPSASPTSAWARVRRCSASMSAAISGRDRLGRPVGDLPDGVRRTRRRAASRRRRAA